MTRRVHVRVPASTSNLGGGFDCVGVAVDRWLSVAIALDPTRNDVRIARKGTLAGLRVEPDNDRIIIGWRAACAYAGRSAPRGICVRARSTIPVARGLGSSAAATIGGAAAANALLELGLDDQAIARIAAGVEGHPDNVAPAVFGGATLAFNAQHGNSDSDLEVRTLTVSPELSLVLAVPEFSVETVRARALLPATLPHSVATRAAALGAALVQGLATADGALISAALDDVLHVPYRRELVRGFDLVVDAARAAGAYGATLSGSGSAIVAVTPRSLAGLVANAMRSAWTGVGVNAEAFESVTPARGYRVRVLAKTSNVPSSTRRHDMPVTLYLPTVLAKLADRQAIETRGSTVGEAVAEVAARYPSLAPRLRDDAGKPYPFVTFYLNDEDIRFQGGFDAPLADGDELTIVPAIAGG
jgi:homoserine kinase